MRCCQSFFHSGNIYKVSTSEKFELIVEKSNPATGGGITIVSFPGCKIDHLKMTERKYCILFSHGLSILRVISLLIIARGRKRSREKHVVQFFFPFPVPSFATRRRFRRSYRSSMYFPSSFSSSIAGCILLLPTVLSSS